MTKKEKRRDNLFSFRRKAPSTPNDAASEDEAEAKEALANVLRAIERLAAKIDALTQGAEHGR